MTIYTITDWLGLVPIMICLIFGIVGLAQLVKRKSIFKVDKDIVLLGFYYVTVIFAYLIFEMIPINYRQILIGGFMEASYPSSTTLLVLSVMPTLKFQIDRRSNIYTLINTGITYILNHINWRAEINRKREDIPEIPVKAIREIVINAFAHAIYEPNPEIEINIYPSMITVFNPGSFPDELTPYDFVSKNISSVKRNPLILDVLYRCKDVEKSGTGFKRMNELCVKEGIKWDSRSNAYGFMFTFYRVTSGDAKAAIDDTIELTNLEKDVLNEIQNSPKITREEIAEDLGKSVRTVQRIIKQLTDKGFLIRIGSKKIGYWEVRNK